MVALQKTFVPTRRGNPCPICGNTDGRCRETADGHLCMNITGGDVPGYRFVKMSKDGTWGFYVHAQDNDTPESIETWKAKLAQLEKDRQAEVEWRRRHAMSSADRHEHYQGLLDQLTLSQDDLSDLNRRGLSDNVALEWGFRSVENYQPLTTPMDDAVPGVRAGGRSLNTLPGYLCPIRSVGGRLLGFQVRLRDAGAGGRYRWLSSKSAAFPDGPSAHLKNGENPITVAYPQGWSGRAGVVGVAEGVLKPFIAAQRWGIPFIGAAGGQIPSSPEQFRINLEKLGAKQIILCPDRGSISNAGVLNQYRGTIDLARSAGVEVQVAWWGQVEASSPDCDEITLGELELDLLPVDQYWELCRDHNWMTLLDAFKVLGLRPEIPAHPAEDPGVIARLRVQNLTLRYRQRIHSALIRYGLTPESEQVASYLTGLNCQSIRFLSLPKLQELSFFLDAIAKNADN